MSVELVVTVVVGFATVVALAGGVVAELWWRRRHPERVAPVLPGSGAAFLRDTVGFAFRFRTPALAWGLLALVVLGALYPVAVQVRDAGVLAAVVFSAWSLAPFAVMAVVVIAAARLSRTALVVVAPGVLALGGLGVWILEDFDIAASSTASLIFLWLPVYQGGVVALTTVAAAGAYLTVWLARRSRARQIAAAGGAR